MKIKLALLLLLFCPFLSAQEKQDKWNIEMGWKPFYTEANYIGIDRIGVKYAVSDKLNVRMLLEYSRIKEHKELDYIQPSPYGYFYQSDYTNTEVNYSFAPGVEYVPIRSSFISAYFGVELLYAVKKTKAEVYRHQNGTMVVQLPDGGTYWGQGTEKTEFKIDGMNYAEKIYMSEYSYLYHYTVHNPSYKQLGVQVPLGVNIYLYKKLYIGLEVKLYYHRKTLDEYRMYGNQLIEMDGVQYHTVLDERRGEAKATSFGISFDNSVRIGIRF